MAYINCPQCEATIPIEGQFCPHCGASTLQAKQVAPTPTPAQATQELPPKSWLVESILVTLLCCQPLGIVGIVFASRVESSWYAGNKELARSSSRTAKTWTLISLGIALAGVLIYVIYWIVMFGFMVNFMDGGGVEPFYSS